MRLTQKVSDSIIFSTAVLVTSILAPIVPCKVAPAVPNPSFSWSLCTLNPDTARYTSSVQEYFGYSSSLTDAFFITLLLAFTLSMVFFHYTTKRKKRERR